MANRTRKAIKSRPGTCDTFAFRAEVIDSFVRLNLATDLPIGTLVSVRIERPSQEYIWEILRENWRVERSGPESPGFTREFSVDELDKLALDKYRYWKGRWPGSIVGLPLPELRVRVFLDPHRHTFGVCNRDLSGQAVVRRPDGHWIECEANLPCPLAGWLPDKLP